MMLLSAASDGASPPLVVGGWWILRPLSLEAQEQEHCLFRTSIRRRYFEGFAHSTKRTHLRLEGILEEKRSYSVFSQKGFILHESNILNLEGPSL